MREFFQTFCQYGDDLKLGVKNKIRMEKGLEIFTYLIYYQYSKIDFESEIEMKRLKRLIFTLLDFVQTNFEGME